MSIAKEIERLLNTKSDLNDVIANKGVTIPEGTLIDKYYKYVDMITTGTNPDTGRDDGDDDL